MRSRSGAPRATTCRLRPDGGTPMGRTHTRRRRCSPAAAPRPSRGRPSACSYPPPTHHQNAQGEPLAARAAGRDAWPAPAMWGPKAAATGAAARRKRARHGRAAAGSGRRVAAARCHPAQAGAGQQRRCPAGRAHLGRHARHAHAPTPPIPLPPQPQAAKEDTKARVKSAYQLWSDSERDNIKAEDSSLKMTDIAKVLGERWKALGDDEKAVRGRVWGMHGHGAVVGAWAAVCPAAGCDHRAPRPNRCRLFPSPHRPTPARCRSGRRSTTRSARRRA
jgi:hypothetical protein